MGMCGPEDPLFMPLLQFTRVPFQARVSSQDRLLRKFWNFSLYSLNFCPNSSSQAPKFENFQLTCPQIGKFSVHKPPNMEIFSTQAPKYGNFQFTSTPFSEASISSQAPHFGNLGRTPLPEKKLKCPPPRAILSATVAHTLLRKLN